MNQMTTNTSQSIIDTHILDAIYPTVDKSLLDRKNLNMLMRKISEYVDKWSSHLLSTNLHERMIFGPSDKAVIFQVTNVNENDVKKAISESKEINSQWKVATNPYYVLSVLILRWLLKNDKKDEFTAMALYFAYPLYISSHYASFKHLPNKDIMEYTINNLSNRFLIKQEGTIQGMIERTVMGAIDGRFTEELMRCTDFDIKEIIYGIEFRIGSNIKYIAEKFYENHKNEKILFKSSGVEVDEEYFPADNNSFAINRISTLVTNSILSNGFDYERIIVRSCNVNAGASPKKLSSIMSTIIEKDRNSINLFIGDILSLFIYKGTGNKIEDIRTLKFLSETLQLYKSNSQDPISERIKNKLLYWVEITANKYGRNFISKGKTSMDTYRRSIYMCFILKIMESAKGGI